MKTYLDKTTNELYAFNKDGSQDSFIQSNLLLITDEEATVIRDLKHIEIQNKPITKDELNARRNSLLSQCDWTQSFDSPLTEEKKVLWRTYRQLLRDLTLTITEYPVSIKWPEVPK